MLFHYLRLVIFAAGLLVGVQVPGFVDQYAKRVSAHEIEAARNFQGFQETADKYFNGNVDALISHHEASADAAFKDEGRTIRLIHDRLVMLNRELDALRAPLLGRIIHVAVRANHEILLETENEYAYTVPLSPATILSGIVIGGLLALTLEGLLNGIIHLLRPRRRHAVRPAHGR